MVLLEKMAPREVNSCNYITSVNGNLHPDRVMREHDFLYILEGEWEIWEDGTCYHMHTDDLLILKAGAHHYGTKPCNSGNRHMYFHVLPTPAELHSVEADTAALPSLIHCGGTPQVRRYFQDLIAVYWSGGEQRAAQLSLLTNLILNTLLEICASSAQGIAGDPLVEQVCRRLRSTPQKMFTASEMADEMFVCARTLNNRFQKALGQTFHTYQTELKLRMVQQYLRCQPKAALSEAAENFGFCDEFHLSHAFKNKFGISPSRYRVLGESTDARKTSKRMDERERG